MPFKIPNITIPIFLILITLSSCGNLKTDNSESLNWMSETSGIQISDSMINLDFYNNHEWGMIAKFETSDTEFEKFIKKNNMTQLKENKMILLNDIEKISLDEEFIKDISNFLTFSDCKTGNSWTLLADRKNKTIWFEVLYPDNGGDIAPCE